MQTREEADAAGLASLHQWNMENLPYYATIDRFIDVPKMAREMNDLYDRKRRVRE